MAADLNRTVADDTNDALAALDAAAYHLAEWRTHLKRLENAPVPGVAQQARHSAKIVASLVADAVARTDDAARRTTEDQLKSVS